MPSKTAHSERNRLSTLGRDALTTLQISRINDLLATVRTNNAFYEAKLVDAPKRIDSIEQFRELPFTTKDELLPPDRERFCRNLTHPAEAYTRYHQTSGTRGRPMPVLDTREDWEWWLRCWQYVLDAANVKPEDRAIMPFSFGPFVGFWAAFEALAARGTLTIPAGGMSTSARIGLIERSEATLLLCTPSYALHLAEAADKQGVRVADLPISRVIVAGEPGGSVPATRARIEAAWGAEVIDHSGATEVGAWGYGDADGKGLRVIESEFYPEFLDVETGLPLDRNDPETDGRLSHLVITTLGRHGAPVIRYRTGDLVRPRWNTPGVVRFVHLEGGVLGRADDMMIIRGVNIYPSAIEQMLHGFPEVVEFRLTARKQGEMDELVIEVEDQLQQPDRITKELELRLGLRVEVKLVPSMSLPRTEHKSDRFIDERRNNSNGD